MQRYKWPGHEMQLLGELQRQQNSAQFCDTLLQTEGISVPTHSCVLAALSPYLSQRLSTLPSPPYGQKRQLQLQAVTAQTLLKLVGLLYSGELEVKGGKEQNDVLAAAHQFGIHNLVGGCKDGIMRRGEILDRGQRIGSCRETVTQMGEGGGRRKSLKTRDAQVQAEIIERRENDLSDKPKNCVSVGTQTVKSNVISVDSSTLLSAQMEPPTPEGSTSGENDSIPLQSRSIALNKQFCFTPCPTVVSDGESTVGQYVGFTTNHTSFSALSTDTCSLSVNDDPRTLRSQEGNTSQESSESRNGTYELISERRGQEDGNANGTTSDDDSENVGHPSQESRDDMLGEENRKSTEKKLSHTKAPVKSLAKMIQMEQISIRLKLKRRTEGEAWEVVGGQDEMSSTCFLEGCSNHTPSQTELEEVHTSSSSAHGPQKPETQNIHLVISASPKSLKHPNSISDSHPPSPGCKTINESSELELVALAQPQGSVEESDEQIERLLEEIMNGLNILPSMDNGHRKSQLSPDRASSCCHIPVTENQTDVNAVGCSAGCIFFQGLGTQNSHSSADTGVACFCGAQNKTSHTSLSVVQPEFLIQQHHSQFNSSIGSSEKSEGMSCRGTSPSKSETSLYPKTATTESSMHLACYPNGHQLDYSGLQQPLSQENSSILDLLPLHGSKTQSEPPSMLSCTDDLRLPQHLSPLETSTPAAGQQSISKPVLQRRPWLSETPESLQFPLTAITANKSAPSLKTSKSCDSEESQQKLDSSLNSGGTCAETCSADIVKEVRDSTEDVNSEPKKMKKKSKCKRDTRKDSASPKNSSQKRTRFSQDGDGSVLVSKKSKVISGSNVFFPETLSNTDILVKREEMATSSLNKPSSVNLRPERARIRTRGFVKKSQENGSNTSLEDFHLLTPAIRRPRVVNKEGVLFPKRKRGRPRKIKLEETSAYVVPAIAGDRNLDERGEQQVHEDSPKTQKDEESKRSCKKQKRNTTEAEAVPLKRTIRAERAGQGEGDKSTNHLGTSKRSWMATLKEFQKLIRQKNSRKSSHEINEGSRDAENEENLKRECTPHESANEEQLEMTIKDGAETDVQVFHNVAVDKNHNRLYKSHPEDTRSTFRKNSLFSPEDHPSSSLYTSDKQLVRLPCEMEQPPENLNEGELSGEGGSDQTPSDGESLSDVHLPQDKKQVLTHKADPRTSDRSAPSVLGAAGIRTNPSQGEEEEDVEVDVLLYSPGKDPPPREYEDGLNNLVLTPDEEEEDEEDTNDIDVTGD